VPVAAASYGVSLAKKSEATAARSPTVKPDPAAADRPDYGEPYPQPGAFAIWNKMKRELGKSGKDFLRS